MTRPDFIPTRDVAELLGVSPMTLLRKRAELEEDHGFPPPVAFAQRPLRWRADLVRGWLDRQGQPRGMAPERPGAFRPYLVAKAATV